MIEFKIEPFDDKFMDTLDALRKDEALNCVQRYIDYTKQAREHYEINMLTEVFGSEKFFGFYHAWTIELNNMIRFKKLYDEIMVEE